MSPVVLVNGEAVANVNVGDRGFQYGDGIFTTLPVCQGVPQLFERHLNRLERDARRLLLPPPDRSLLVRDARRVLAEQSDGVLKIQITRGIGGRGYRPPEAAQPTLVLAFHPGSPHPPKLRTEGVSVRLCRTRLGRNPALAGIKHLNRLEQVLARAEWSDPAIREGLMLDTEDRLIEGTMSNLFLVRDGGLVTPRLDACGIAGVVRELVLQGAADLGLPAQEAELELADLAAADEAFLTNSVIQCWPIRLLEGRAMEVGPVTRRMAAWLNERIQGESAAWHG